MHGPPYGAVGIILKEQMINAVIIYHSVRIIHPIFGWSEMDLRAIRCIALRVEKLRVEVVAGN